MDIILETRQLLAIQSAAISSNSGKSKSMATVIGSFLPKPYVNVTEQGFTLEFDMTSEGDYKWFEDIGYNDDGAGLEYETEESSRWAYVDMNLVLQFTGFAGTQSEDESSIVVFEFGLKDGNDNVITKCQKILNKKACYKSDNGYYISFLDADGGCFDILNTEFGFQHSTCLKLEPGVFKAYVVSPMSFDLISGSLAISTEI